MIIAADGDAIGAEHVPPEIREEGTSSPARPNAPARTFVERKAEAERQIIIAALERNEWHITRTAQELGLADHASLLKIMRRHHIARE
jgi:transcriptional regulator with GAF, ATPase, and Fis domain